MVSPACLLLVKMQLTDRSFRMFCDLRDSFRGHAQPRIGVVYVELYPTSTGVRQILQTSIFRLALQANMEPELDAASLSNPDLLLKELLLSIIRQFHRTFFLIDGLDALKDELEPHADTRTKPILWQVIDLLESILGNEDANVSVAVFSRPLGTTDTLLDVADVSMRMLRIEHSSEDIREYVRFKLARRQVEIASSPTLLNDIKQTDRFYRFCRKTPEMVDAIVVASDGL